ncbi:hypothetical protein LCGC14_0770580 [marine sediment metagenome]|uniref:Uncharacterized protein n=1 Tax=marine sediment metagenome TaxID=412755 RepID=A0A0F9QI75_9ZZZZ
MKKCSRCGSKVKAYFQSKSTDNMIGIYKPVLCCECWTFLAGDGNSLGYWGFD